MDNILFLIVWGLFIFVLPNVFGKKNKKDKPYEYPDEKTETSSPVKTKENESPWLTWGLPEPKLQEKEIKVKEEAKEVSEYMSALKRIKQEKPREQSAVASVVKNVRPKKRLTYQDLRRGIILAEVLGKPRALNPYNEKK
ncbi:MAG: hypothetical protein ACRC8T_08320 [Acidaminococcaceae bacterium]